MSHVRSAPTGDRFGLGWRPDLAAGVLSNLDRIDVVEVMADDWFDAPTERRRALRTLAAQVPVVLHGVGLGAASTVAVERTRVDDLARLVELVRPAFWSEHLAFVRGGGIEIGHLAAPPRCEATIAGTATNVDAAARIVGARPLMENIATLIDPPGGTMDEPEWLSRTIAAAGCDLLLDLHNLYANAVNFGSEPGEFLARLPLERVAAVHIAGGKWITARRDGRGDDRHERRLLDDHQHDVPDPVYELLAALGAATDRPLTVILEQDGDFPPVAHLLAQLDRARAALACGRARRAGPVVPPASTHGDGVAQAAMAQRALAATAAGSPGFESFLARLYSDDALRARFLLDPAGESAGAGLSAAEVDVLRAVDRTGLAMAGESFRRKRASRPPARGRPGWLDRVFGRG